jgi:hypothetical protein
MSENCSFCDKPMEDLGLRLWYCRFCEKYWRRDLRSGIMERVIMRDMYDMRD